MDARQSPAFATLLRHFRTEAGLSQEKLAEQTGLSVRGISDLERGARRNPRVETLRLLADALDLSPADRTRLLSAARPPGTTRPGAKPVDGFLPTPPTPLVGRRAEMDGILRAYRDDQVRLLTLVGPGGVGKTRLALEIAHALAPDAGGTVAFVPLAVVNDPALLVPSLMRHLGLPESGRDSAFADLVVALAPQAALLILDNFEHLLPAAQVVADLLAACPALRILVTSQSPLHLRGEREWPLDPLPVPADGSAAPVEDIAAIDAVRLFTERVTAVNAAFTLTPANARSVVEICRRLDGVPLAIELAAAQAPIFTPEGLLEHLDKRRLGALGHGPRDLPPRHRTMRGTLAWSYDLLDPAAQALFRRLAVVTGPWTLDAAEVIADPILTPDVVGSLHALVDSSLVRIRSDAAPQRQFEMLEIVREFGLEQLAACGDGHAAREAHAAWMLGVVDAASTELVGPNRGTWMARLDANIGNLRAALGWTLMHGDVASTVRLIAPIWLSWFERGRAGEARSWLLRALQACDEDDTAVRADALFALGSIAGTQLDYDPAEACLRQSLALWRRLGDTPKIAHTAHTLGIITLEAGDDARALEFLREGADTYARIPELRDSPWAALAKSQVAAALSRLGDAETARALASEARQMQEAAGSPSGVALALLYIGDIALDRGETGPAWTSYAEAIRTMRETGDSWYLLHSLPGFTITFATLFPPEQAAVLAGAERAARRETGNGIPPRHRAAHAAAIDALRNALGHAAFDEAAARGEAIGLDAVLAGLLEGATAPCHSPQP